MAVQTASLRDVILDLHTPYYQLAGQTLIHRVSVPADEVPDGHVCVIGEWDQCDKDEHWIEACRECRWATEDGDPAYPLWPCPTAKLALAARIDVAVQCEPTGVDA